MSGTGTTGRSNHCRETTATEAQHGFMEDFALHTPVVGDMNAEARQAYQHKPSHGEFILRVTRLCGAT